MHVYALKKKDAEIIMWCGVSAEDQNTEIRVVAQYQKERINEKEKERLKETVTTTETIQLSIKSCYHCSAITNTLISVYNCDNTPNSNKVTGLLIHNKRRARSKIRDSHCI